MRPIFLKELRENFKWAVVIFGVFSVLIYLGEIREARQNLLFHICDPGISIIPVAIAGLLMGLAQSLFETRPDNWAFVVQRPVSRASIFLNKSAAGLLLLLVALGLPSVLTVAWAAAPGNLPMPFQWRMVLPLLACLLLAGPFYFAGMVLTLRKARWFGSRLLPLGLAIGCIMAVIVVPQFWQAALIVVSVTLIGALAAWDVFATGGADGKRGVPSFALGTMIYAGALGLGCFLVVFLGIFQTKAMWHDQRVDRAGNLLRITWTLEHRDRTCVVADADGHPLSAYDGIDIDDPVEEASERFARFSSGLIDQERIELPRTAEAGWFGYRESTPGVIGLRAVAKSGIRFRRICLFDVPRQIIDVFDPITRQMLGTIGPAGFATGETLPAEKFPEKPLNAVSQAGTHTLSFPSIVYWMELDQHRVRPIYTAAPDDPVVAAMELPPQTDPMAVVVTRKKLHIMLPSGEVVFSAVHDLDLSKYWFNFATLPSQLHVLMQATPLEWESATEYPYRLLEFDKSGKLVRSTTAPPWVSEAQPTKLRRTAMMGAVYPLAGVPLLSPNIMDYAFDLDIQKHGGLFHGFLIASAILSAAATLLIARRCGFSTAKTIAWSLANGLLGPAGVVVMLSLNDWPSREVCASCGGQRLVDRRNCTRCGVTLPSPMLDGREIFEPEDAFPSAA